jgi:hypothetical protein
MKSLKQFRSRLLGCGLTFPILVNVNLSDKALAQVHPVEPVNGYLPINSLTIKPIESQKLELTEPQVELTVAIISLATTALGLTTAYINFRATQPKK